MNTSDLLIAAIDVERVSVRYRRPFVISSGKTTVLESLLVTIRTTDGFEGVGEVNPMTAYSGETGTGVEEGLRRFLAPAITGCSAFEIAALHRRMDEALRGNRLAKAGIDIALYDLVGKALAIPVSHLLGGPVRPRLPLVWVVGMGSINEMVEEAVTYANRGFQSIKLKIGKDPTTDLSAVAAVREAIGQSVALRVDANQGYDVVTARRVLKKMERYDLELVEQPVAGHDIDGMAELTRALDVPVMADESLQSLADAFKIAQHRAADVFNIKVVKPGGLYRSQQIATVAEAAGLTCMVGSMPELGVATLAGAHFAAATPGVTYPCELIGPMMTEDDVLEDPVISLEHAPGYLAVPTTPGLGAKVKDVNGRAR